MNARAVVLRRVSPTAMSAGHSSLDQIRVDTLPARRELGCWWACPVDAATLATPFGVVAGDDAPQAAAACGMRVGSMVCHGALFEDGERTA